MFFVFRGESLFMKPFLMFLLTAGLLLANAAGQSASKRKLIGNLQNTAVADGCGCYFQFRDSPRDSQQHLFFSSIDEEAEKTAWMNIEGRDVKLALATKTSPKGKERIGSRLTRRYVGEKQIVVDATYITTRVCKPNEESCESTQYVATFTVRKGKKRQVVRAVGSCGC